MPERAAWVSWSQAEWNQALFDYLFVGDDDYRVTRLVISGSELRHVTGDEGALADDVRKAFIRALWCSPTEFKLRLSARRYPLRRGEWTQNSPPPFLAYLILTCLVASDADDALMNEGDFRRRLRLVLAHPEGTSYGLEDVSFLWEVLKQWIDWQREEGRPYRELILPDPGYMTRIGYSIRLAFPTLRDQQRLLRIFVAQRLDANPSIREVLSVIDRSLKDLSAPFRSEYEVLRRSATQGSADIELSPLWSAIRDAVAASQRTPDRAERARFQLFLFEDEDGAGELVLSTSLKPPSTAQIQYVESQVELGLFRHVLSIGDSGGGTHDVVSRMLGGSLPRLLPSFAGSAVELAVRQGVLLFTRDDTGTRVLSTGRPQDATVCAFVRDDLKGAFGKMLTGGPEVVIRRSAYATWAEVGEFDSQLLENAASVGALRGIRCLEPRAFGVSIHLSGGVRLQVGYLNGIGLPPRVRVSHAKSVRVARTLPGDESTQREDAVDLDQCAEDPTAWCFPDRPLDDGSYTILARRDAGVARRALVLRSNVIWTAYRGPARLEDWLAESSGPDVLPLSEVDGLVGRPVMVPAATSLPGARDQSDVASPSTRLRLGGAPARTPTEPPPAMGDREPAMTLRAGRLVEVLAAVGMARTGIPEEEFLDLVQRVLRLRSPAAKWDVTRAWLEAGLVDCLAARRWRTRHYFVREPHLVVLPDALGTRMALCGLAPRQLSAQVERSATTLGATRVAPAEETYAVPELSSWGLPDPSTADVVSSQVGLKLTRLNERPSFRFPSISQVVKADAGPTVTGYVRESEWDWNRAVFLPRAPRERPVRVLRYTRQDRPAIYEIRQNTEPVWSTISRNWALLTAYALADELCYGLLGGESLRRTSHVRVHLPLPVARTVTLASGVPSGPERDGQGYRYRFDNGASRAQLVAALWAGPRVGGSAARALRWILRVATRQSMPDVPRLLLSKLERAALQEMTGEPSAQALARMAIPVTLHPHVRNVVRRLSGAN
jgi:hypothetical protein